MARATQLGLASKSLKSAASLPRTPEPNSSANAASRSGLRATRYKVSPRPASNLAVAWAMLEVAPMSRTRAMSTDSLASPTAGPAQRHGDRGGRSGQTHLVAGSPLAEA